MIHYSHDFHYELNSQLLQKALLSVAKKKPTTKTLCCQNDEGEGHLNITEARFTKRQHVRY